MYSGKDIHPFNNFNLSCTATKPSRIIPSLQLNWYHDGTELDDSVSGITILEQDANNGMQKSSVVTVTSARVFNSGMYTCSAAVSIPESNTVMMSQVASATITGIHYPCTDM